MKITLEKDTFNGAKNARKMQVQFRNESLNGFQCENKSIPFKTESESIRLKLYIFAIKGAVHFKK